MCYIRIHVITGKNSLRVHPALQDRRGQYMLVMMRQYLLDQRMLYKMDSKKKRIIACPVCGKAVVYENNPYRPFCSRGCKGVDFIRWSDESYRIAKGEHEDDNGVQSNGE